MRLPALPRLDSNEIRCLSAGLAVQKQSRDGLAGNGYVAIDMRASPEAVWSLLTDYAKYEERIPTVRASSVQPGATKDNCRATYVLSKFRLEVPARSADPAACPVGLGLVVRALRNT